MSEQQKADPQAKPQLSPQETINLMMPMLHKMLPQLVEIAALYHRTYPADKTAPEVVDAVTVAVPLRHFMVSTAILTHLCLIDRQREKAPAAPMNDPEVSA